MRVKQTARKSTASLNTSTRGSRGAAPGSSSEENKPDPVKLRQRTILQTKRKSLTPTQRQVREDGTGLSKLSLSFPRSGGKRISMDDGVKTKPRQKRRHKPGQLALKEIKKLQDTNELLIPRAAFHRLVREITQNVSEEEIRFQTAALMAIQEACEAYLVQYFEDSFLCTLHAKRVTLFVQDMQLCRRLQRHKGYYT